MLVQEAAATTTGSTNDESSDADNDSELELAVDIIDSVQLGSGAGITCLAAIQVSPPKPEFKNHVLNDDHADIPINEEPKQESKKRKQTVFLNDDTLQKESEILSSKPRRDKNR